MAALATPLPALAWSALILGVLLQAFWIGTDGRRPAMPTALYDCMAGAIGEICCGMLIIAFAVWSPERVPALLIVMTFFIWALAGQSISWQSAPEPPHPMTAQWQRAMRRYYFRSRLCIGAGCALALNFAFSDPLQCGLAAIALLNLPYLDAYRQARASSERAGRWRLLAPVAVPLTAFILAGWPVPAGTDILLNDLYISVSAPIPTSDAATIGVLQLYLNLSLLILLFFIAIEQLGGQARFGEITRLLSKRGMFWLRVGGMAGCFFSYLPGLNESASAWVVSAVLMLVEISIALAPSPVPASELEPERAFEDTILV